MTFTTWRDPPLPTSNVGPIRLVAAGDSVAIYCGDVGPAIPDNARYPYRTALTPIAVAGPKPAEIIIAQNLPTTASFDLTVTGNNALTFAIENFGGAANALVIGSADQGKVAVQATYRDFNDYRFPRFVRGDAAPGQMVTAIANRSFLVAMTGKPLLPTEVGLKGDPFLKLAAATSGLAIATTPPNGGLKGAAVLAKTGTAGPPLPTSDFLGTLTLTSLSGGRSIARPVVLFDPDATYAFDADVQSDVILVLASTRLGPRLLACNVTGAQTTPIAWPDDGYPPTGTWIAYPTVLAMPGAAGSRLFSIAFFEFVADVMKGIRYAQLDLSKLP